MKDTNDIQMKEIDKARYVGRDAKLLALSWAHYSPNPPRGHPPRNSPNAILLEFYGGFLM